MSMQNEPEPIVIALPGVPIVFNGMDEVPILYANNFLIQYESGDFVLTVGQLNTPLLMGTEEEQREQAQRITHVSVKVVARIALNRSRLEQLNGLLTQHLLRFPAQLEGST